VTETLRIARYALRNCTLYIQDPFTALTEIEVAMFVACVWEVPGLNVGRDTPILIQGLMVLISTFK
jgi:hypothetical protein